MKKLLSAMLAVIIMMSSICSSARAASDNTTLPIYQYENIILQGTYYYEGMEAIKDRSQMQCELQLNSVAIGNGSVEFEGILIEPDKSPRKINGKGSVFKSAAEKLRSVQGMTAVITDSLNCDVLCFQLEKEAHGEDLLPANRSLDGEPIIKIAIKSDESIIYFEEAFPVTTEYNYIYDYLVDEPNNQNPVLSPIYGLSNEESNNPVTELDIVQNAEAWLSNAFQSDETPVCLDNTVSLESRATFVKPSEVRFIPDRVFTDKGTWYSVNNPNNPMAGYYAITTEIPGSTTNRIIELIAWEYIGNPCDNITSGTRYGSNGTTGLKVLAVGEYRYYKEDNLLGQFTSSPQFKIKNGAFVMAINSLNEILYSVDRSMQSENKSVTINWSSLLGLLPLGKVYSTAVAIFNAIEYRDGSSSSGTIIYQSTAQNQQSIYGKLVKGHKMTCDDHMLAKPGDNAIIKYTVSQPSDLTRTTGSKQVFNKYYFVIVGKNGLTFQFSDKKLTVEQYRDCSYRVS